MSRRVISAEPVEVIEVVDRGRTARFEETAITLPDAGSLALVRKRLAGAQGPGPTPLLLVHGFGQNLHAWHLSQRSLVNHLAAEGHDVFSLDLRGHGRSRAQGARPAAALHPYVDEDFPAAMDAIAALTGRPRVVLAGHSLGGMLAYAATARSPERVQALVTLAAPYFWGRGATLVHALSRGAALIGRGGRGETAFPMGAVRSMLRATQPLWDTGWLPMPIRAWHPGGFEPDVLAEYLARSFDRASFGELAQLTDSSDDDSDHFARDFEGCDVPLLVVAGTNDHLARPAAVRPAFERSSSRDRTFVTFPSGHGDLLLGRKAPHLLWPTLTRWLHRRTSP